MKSKSEEFLNLLLWSTDILGRPTFRNLTDSYESWTYRQGWWRQVLALERRRFVERDLDRLDERFFRLTSKGRRHALGGRDPEARWSREWDGRWRLVVFDIPTTQNTQRAKLQRYLRDQGFGYLQRSVWITPDPFDEERQTLFGNRNNVESLILWDARPCAGETDAEIVAGSWDFEEINRRYARYLEILGKRPVRALGTAETARSLFRWAAAEHAAWLDAVRLDPLLPERILPSGYLGKNAWRRRIQEFRETRQQMRTFSG